jgi:glycogen debranching enzyme
MPISFDRSTCCDLNETISREWLITNGLGGYASGTVAGVLTRMQHGLLVSSPLDAATPQLLLAKIDEEVIFDQRTYFLGAHEYQDGTLNPSGFVHLETFRLEEGFPIFTYRIGGIEGILLEKRVWMPRGLNTTYIQYRVLRNTAIDGSRYESSTGQALGSIHAQQYRYPGAAQHMLTLKLLPFSAYRPYAQPQYGDNDWHFHVQALAATQDSSPDEQHELALPRGVTGCTIRAWNGAHPYHILAVGHAESEMTFIPTGVWYWRLLRRHDRNAGLPPTDDLYLPGVIRAKLWPGDEAALTIIVTAEDLSTQTLSLSQINRSYTQSVERQRSFSQPQRYFGEGGETAQSLPVLPLGTDPANQLEEGEYLRTLLQAGDRFFISRVVPRHDLPEQVTVLFNQAESIPLALSGYYSGKDSTRDTLVAFPGLALATGRYTEASRILRSFARYFKQGLLPDRLPAPGRPLEERDYGSVDTTLWYFYALDHYLNATHDYELLNELYVRLVESISWYERGTYNGIQVDAQDGLLRAQQAGKALTWMNASFNGVPVTPREGKPVEVNALWYHALSLMHTWSQTLYALGSINFIPTTYQERSARCKQSFNQRFWYAGSGYLYDVIDGPGGDDPALRPNQLLALALGHAVLSEKQQKPVLDIVERELLTPYGLRTLAPQAEGYVGHLAENLEEQQRGLHQGSVWPWLIGPYIDATLRVEALCPTSHGQATPQHEEPAWRKMLQILNPLRILLSKDTLGMIGDVYDGEEPHNARHNIASAISVGENLRVYKLLAHMSVQHPLRTISV